MARNRTGPPAKYETSEEFLDKFYEYLDHCVEVDRMPTMAGAAIWMGYANKQTLYEQKERDQSKYKKKGMSWTQAVEHCMTVMEDVLINDRSTMAIFVLKCKYRYKESFQIDNTHSGPDGKPIEHKWQVEVIDNAQDKDPA